jgi:metallo-beta-lactamase family protein
MRTSITADGCRCRCAKDFPDRFTQRPPPSISALPCCATRRIAESDAEFVNRHHPDAEPVEPLYTRADADATMTLFRPGPYRKPIQIAGGLTLEFFDAGHVLGSAFLVLDDGRTKLGFSGRCGTARSAYHSDPEPLPPVD